MSEPMSNERLAKLFADLRGEDGLSLNEIDALESEVERLRGERKHWQTAAHLLAARLSHLSGNTVLHELEETERQLKGPTP